MKSGDSTTVKVSKETALKLARLQQALRTGTMDETIRALVERRKTEALSAAFGAAKGRIGSFTEGDRGENRS